MTEKKTTLNNTLNYICFWSFRFDLKYLRQKR